MRKILLVAMTTVVAGCYSYVPSTISAIPTGAHISADLTARGTVGHESQLGGEAQAIEGIMSRPRMSDSVEILLTRIRNRNGSWTTWTREPVVFSHTEFASVRQRKLSMGRTTAAAGAFAGLFAVMVAADIFGLGGDGGGEGKPDPGPQ